MKKKVKQTKEKMIKAADAEAKFNALKKQAMVTSYYAAKSVQEILDIFREFVNQVLMTQPNEQTLLKKLAEEKNGFIDERQSFVDLITAVTSEFVDEEDEDED